MRRSAEPTAAISRPITSAGTAPTRAIRSDPGTAAAANRITGSPVSTPISVPDKRKSDWIIASTGGIARIGRRRALPESQSKTIAVKSRGTAVMAGTRPGITNACRSCCALQALEGVVDLGAPIFRIGALFALLIDDFLRRTGQEVGVVELLVDAIDVVGHSLQLLLKPCSLGGEIDN